MWDLESWEWVGAQLPAVLLFRGVPAPCPLSPPAPSLCLVPKVAFRSAVDPHSCAPSQRRRHSEQAPPRSSWERQAGPLGGLGGGAPPGPGAAAGRGGALGLSRVF